MKYGHTITIEFTSEKEEPIVGDINLALKQFIQVAFSDAENIKIYGDVNEIEEDDGDVDEF